MSDTITRHPMSAPANGATVVITAPATGIVIGRYAGKLTIAAPDGKTWAVPAEACRVVEGEG